MNLEELKRIARETMKDRVSHQEREPGYILRHGMRTANLSGEIMAAASGIRDVFDEVLYAGGLFHDVGKGFKPHNEVGAQITNELLASVCNSRELDDVSNIVRFHCIRKHDIELETRILVVQDADMIDHFGTQEVWLNFYYGSYHRKGPEHSIVYWESDEWKRLLEDMRDLLNFDLSKKIFDERVEFQAEFLARFKVEVEGGIYKNGKSYEST